MNFRPSSYGRPLPGVNPRYLREYQSMGTAGGILHFRDEILKSSPDAFFVLNGDIASSFPLQEMLSTHKKTKGVGTILSVRMEKKKLSRFGCLVIDENTLQVQHFVEKPQTFVSDLISCGVYIFGKDVFSSITLASDKRRMYEADNGIDISQFEHKASLAASNAALSKIADRVQLEVDLIPELASEKSMFAHVMGYDDFWMPIKTGSSTIAANRLYLQHFLQSQPRRLSAPSAHGLNNSPIDAVSPTSPAVFHFGIRTHPEIIPPAFIHPTAVVHPSAKIGPNAFIGPNVLVGRGARIRDALILDAVEIKNEACILNAVVGWESKIGAWTRVEGSNSNEFETSYQDAATAKGFKLPSAAILGRGVIIADELIIRDCIILPHKEVKQSYQREILM